MSPHAILVHYGYPGIFIALILEFLLIPFPAETILVFSGFMWHQGVFRIVPLLIIATLGSFTGSLIAYLIGSYVGRPVLLRYGRYVRLDEKKLIAAETAFRKYSIPIVGFGRFIAGVRVLIAYVAGMNKLNVPLYLVITIISAALWASMFILLGSTVSAYWHVGLRWIEANPVPSGLIALILIVAGSFYFRYRRDKKRNPATVTAKS
ncbi:hypothetical protein BM613_03265 [Sulfoacidibacillus thermotolerans]|uniref:VTT domain-containing protein n=2 Tax=Sulfoacidibacillus thermotolerans TaxID=1765684 RepID=A0A2U3DB88_SULT2|nr:hypothetical protein BM613_03265 [Sulfoacidibacillus thermotolerans]